MYVLGFNEPAKKLAEMLDAAYLPVSVRVFPDGEINPRIMFDDVLTSKDSILSENSDFILAAWWNPSILSVNGYLMSILYVLKHVKQQFNPRRMMLVLPYHVYARQDKEFRTGEIVSSKILSSLLEDCGLTHFITVTSHLTRNLPLSRLFRDVVPHEISGVEILASEVRSRIDDGRLSISLADSVVVAPDHNAMVWAEEFARTLGIKTTTYLLKERNRETGEITQTLPDDSIDIQEKTLFLIDDIVSTGSTMYKAARIFLEQGARNVAFCYVHAVHSTPESVSRLKTLNPLVLMTTNSILIGSEYEVERVSLVSSLAASVRHLLSD